MQELAFEQQYTHRRIVGLLTAADIFN